MKLPVVTAKVGHSMTRRYNNFVERKAYEKQIIDRLEVENPAINRIIDGILTALDDVGEDRLTLEVAKEYVRSAALTIYAALEAQAATETAN